MIEHLGGGCPVQAWGTCEGAKWYFRARWAMWSISVAEGDMDPVGLDAESGGAFYYEEDYGDGPYSAGSMPEDEARYFIVRELSRFRASRPPCGGAT